MTEIDWVDVIAVDEVPEDDVVCVSAGGREIALYQVEGQVFATSNLFTHGTARLCDGFLDGHAIECPLHQGRFDIRTGQALAEPAVDPLPTFATKVDAGRVLVKLG
ncbi:MAG: hypothetical protein RLZZ200_1053 [Pseudomonadota bacterium]